MTNHRHSVSDTPTFALLQPEDALLALRNWHRENLAENPLSRMYLFQSLQWRESGSNRRIANLILEQGLAQLALENVELDQVLRSRFLDRQSALEVASDMNIAESTLFNRQNEAINELTRILLELDHAARQKQSEELLLSLPKPQDINVTGIEHYLAELCAMLESDDAPSILAIEGIGGIGKTTLADRLVRHAVTNNTLWEQVAWVTARQNYFGVNELIAHTDGPAITVETLIEELYERLLPDLPRPASFDDKEIVKRLRLHLTTHRCLVVVDNLETVADVESLLPLLRQLTGPTRFVLTSRKSLYTERDIFHFEVPELSLDDVLSLVRTQAEASNLPHVAAASDDELRPIYETVGGNPLALHLIVGQLHIHGLEEILSDLVEARTETAGSLYIFIYRCAWDSLDESARRALIAMVLTTDDGDTVDELLATCDLTRAELRNALNHLVTLNLVRSLGGLNERRYSIHQLTRSFLHKQVLLWA